MTVKTTIEIIEYVKKNCPDPYDEKGNLTDEAKAIYNIKWIDFATIKALIDQKRH